MAQRPEVENLTHARSAIEMMRPLYAAGGFETGFDSDNRSSASNPCSHVDSVLTGTPITLRQVAGAFVFSEGRIDLQDVGGRIENNGFRISGQINGYRPDSPLFLKIESLQSENIYIPESPRYISSLPRQVQELYGDFKPQGSCRLEFEVERKSPGQRPRASGRIDVVNGEFVYSLFPYPLREATGRITFGPDPATGKDIVRIVGLRGRGVPRGPNQNAVVAIDGVIGPINPEEPGDVGCEVRVGSRGISSEPALERAFPPDVARTLKLLGVTEVSGFPTYHGDFVCNVHHAAGTGRHFTFATDLSIDDASGGLAGFPYPLRHVAGQIKVRDGYLDVIGVQGRHGDSTIDVDGRISWVDASKTKLNLKVRKLPIDRELLAALPLNQRQWLVNMGVSGLLDIDGAITTPSLPPPGAIETTPGLDLISYDLSMNLREGRFQPLGSEMVATGLSARLHLTRIAHADRGVESAAAAVRGCR